MYIYVRINGSYVEMREREREANEWKVICGEFARERLLW